MSEYFQDFMSALKETHFALGDYVDFKKVETKVNQISIKLTQLNYLIGKDNLAEAVNLLWEENPKTFSVLEILIALRGTDKKKAIDSDGNTFMIQDCFRSPEQVVLFLNQTGLAEVFRNKQITNLVDYVFGVEVGLDSNARKNRGGRLMEAFVAQFFSRNGISFEAEVCYDRFQKIKTALGKDKKRFDFVIRTPKTIYLIEANFYTGGGSKLNEVARSYSELAPKINAIPGYEFVWITDGTGWKDARSKLEEAFLHIPNIYNLSNLHTFISRIKGTAAKVRGRG